MFQNIHEQMEVFECVIVIEDNGSVNFQQIAMPRVMIQQQFIELVQQAHQINRPIRISISRTVPIYDHYRDVWIEREHSIDYKNLAYVEK